MNSSTSSLADKIRAAKRIYIIGNGGSFANAQHIANDLLACGVRAYTIDPATFSAFANDYGYYKGFARWIATVGEAGDLLIALSGSGRSPNILLAVEEAERKGMAVETIYGAMRGENMQQAEEAQLHIGHKLRAELIQS